MPLGDRYTAQEVDSEIDKQFAEGSYSVPKEVVKMLARNENMERSGKVNFGNLKSSADARGVMQVIPSTLAGLKASGYLPADSPDDLNSGTLRDQVRAGIAAVAEMSTRMKTKDPLELAALYHGGTGALADYRAGDLSRRPNTANYVMKAKTIMADPTATSYKLGNNPSAFTMPTPASVQPTATPPIASAEDAGAAYRALFPAVMEAFGMSNRSVQTESIVQQGALQASSAALQESTRLNAEAVIAQEQAHQQLLQRTGLDISDPEAYISQMFTKKAELGSGRQQARDRIDELQSVSFLENPLGFLMNIPEMKRTVVAHNRIVDEENVVDADLAKRLATANSLKPITPAKTADILRAKAVADSQVIAADASSKLAASKANASAATAKNIADQFNEAGNMLGRMMQAENMEDQRIARGERRDAAAEKAAEAQKFETFATGINIYRGMINGKNTRPLTADDIKGMSPAQRAEWAEVVDRGNFGNNYAQSVPFINDKGNKVAAAEAGNSAMMTIANNLEMQARNMTGAIEADYRKQNGMLAPKIPDRELQSMAFARLYSDHAKLAAKGIDKSSISTSDSPYKFDYNSVIAMALANPEAANNVVVRSLLTQKSLAPTAVVTDRQLLANVQAEVIAKKLDPKLAAMQIAEFYRTMAEDTYKASGLRYFGLPKLEDYTILPGERGNLRLDLMNSTMVENYLQTQLSIAVRHSKPGLDGFIGAGMDAYRKDGDFRGQK